MNYCRSLSFTDDPDYTYIFGLFQSCMERHDVEVKTPDFIWYKNRLQLEKIALKENMRKAMDAKPKKKPGDDPKNQGGEKKQQQPANQGESIVN